MKISKRLQNKYRSEISALANAAGDYVSSYLSEIRRINPEADIAEIREATKESIEDALNAFGVQAGNVACELFDEIVAAENLQATSKVYDVIDRDMMTEKVHFFAGKLVYGDLWGFQRDITNLTKYYVKRTAFENVIKNCTNNDIRYARVPSGVETCAFCFMLSSRGFVYHSEATANGRTPHGMHRNCDCIVVPGVKGVTQIDGYDPDLMYERWAECARTVGVNIQDGNSYKNRHKIMAEVATRDYKWLYSDKKDYESKIRVQDGVKPKPKEIKVAERLSKSGFEVLFLKPSNIETQRTADLRMNGIKWEIKQPVGNVSLKTIGKSTLDHQFEDAAQQCNRLILDLTVIEKYESVGYERAASKSLDLFHSKWKNFFKELILFSESGIRRYKNAQ